MKTIYSIALVLFLASCGSSEKPKDKKAELEQLKKDRTALNGKIEQIEKELGQNKSQADTKDVTATELKETEFRNFVEVQGKVDAEDNVEITPESQGSVTAIYVKVGQSVSRGQVLAQIDDKVLRQNIAQLQTQLDLATTVFNRQKNLWDQKIGTEVQYLTEKSKKEGLQKQLSGLQSQAAMNKIKSPVSGTVDAMELKLGQSVAPGTPTGIRVVNASRLKVKALVSENYAARVNQGDEVEVSLPDVPENLHTKISFAAKVIDPISRGFNVEVKLPSSKKYRPNMLAILKIIDYKNDKALTVPVNAIQKSEAGEYVFVAINGKAKKTDIKTGKISNSQAEVLTGLKSGDKVITTGFQDLNDGDSVKL
ncbi:efflux RND transporter periplasmic adaptor subunit [Pedobacter sp. V48]|jgi:membrane fusion protein (multidrug efflux system)|uniref:efflux RND transporter periplasmic adaptor subunit n=1 Tax=Pedobacter sp. V48 TaxID=509635 RepID=UPI0003E528DA|nr:efflux RND transporter periplasmic adaptor subunit [Pedobacter sp. V48]ETZ24489.1 RND transporter [Pedobacter sp. V48]